MKLEIDFEQADLLVKALRLRLSVLEELALDNYDTLSERSLAENLIADIEAANKAPELPEGWIEDGEASYYRYAPHGAVLRVWFDAGNHHYWARITTEEGQSLAERTDFEDSFTAGHWADLRFLQLPDGVFA